MRHLTTRTAAWLASASLLGLAACETVANPTDTAPVVADDPPVEAAMNTAEETVVAAAEAAKPAMTNAERLDAILAAQPDDVQARYGARNPAETLAFFGIEPGMTVAEALPGGGWYTKILLPYLGPDGEVVGAQYPYPIWERFGFGEEWAQERVVAAQNWATSATEWGVVGAADISSYEMTNAQEEMAGSLDAMLFVRALHNLHRFNGDTSWFDQTLAETFTLLKPGGVVGIVQHSAPEDNADAWADGSAGYLKPSRVIEAFEAAGFVLEASSDVNANPADMPTESDVVWRLPPSLATTEEGSAERDAVMAIGESSRMTLRFRKPA